MVILSDLPTKQEPLDFMKKNILNILEVEMYL